MNTLKKDYLFRDREIYAAEVSGMETTVTYKRRASETKRLETCENIK